MGRLAGLAFAAVGCAPHLPVLFVADGVAAAPELGRDAGVGRIFEQAAQFAVLDLVGDFGAELEVEPLVVNAPALVHLHIDTVVGIGDQVLELPLARLQVDVGHADQGDAVPAIGPHGPAGRFGRGLAHDLAELLGCLPRSQIAAKDALPDDGHALGGNPLIVPAKGPQAAGDGRVGGQVDHLGAVAKGAILFRGEETGPGVAGLRAEHPVQLDGVAARFVDLQGQLGRAQDEGGDAAGAGIGPEEGCRLLADAGGVL